MNDHADSAASKLERACTAIDSSKALNIWSYLDLENAHAAAAASDARRCTGQLRGPLDGELIAIKGNIAVANWPYEGGLRVRRGVRAHEDAPIIAKLRASGAILLGQTSMDAGALGATGRSIDGPIGLPQAPALSVGGSSGGSAAAIAAGHCAYALGTDTIGSVRIPAALSGITALKPTFGLLSTGGVLPVHERFDHVGPMAARIDQLQILFDVLRGRAANHATEPASALRLAAVDNLDSVGVDPQIVASYEAALEKLLARGHSVTRIDVARFDLGRVRRAVLALCEFAMWSTHRETLQTQPEAYDEPLRAMLEFGSRLSSDKLTEMSARIAGFNDRWRQATSDFDVTLTPTTTVLAFPHSEPSPDTVADLTVMASATGLPAISVPLPVDSLPIGLQVIGHHNDDERLCTLAEGIFRTLVGVPTRDR